MKAERDSHKMKSDQVMGKHGKDYDKDKESDVTKKEQDAQVK